VYYVIILHYILNKFKINTRANIIYFMVITSKHATQLTLFVRLTVMCVITMQLRSELLSNGYDCMKRKRPDVTEYKRTNTQLYTEFHSVCHFSKDKGKLIIETLTSVCKP